MTKNNEEISLKEILLTLFVNKSIVIYSILTFASFGIVFSLFIPNKYTAETLIIPAEDESISSISKLGGLSTLSGISGIELPKPSIVKSELALEIMTSKKFLYKFIDENNLLVNLMAVKSWSKNDNKLIINKKIYDQKLNKWVRDVSYPFKPKPNNYEAYKYWIKNIYSIDKSDKSRFIKIKLSHQSPYIAQKWSNMLINEINNELKEMAISESLQRRVYLEQEIARTSDNEIKKMLYELIEEEMRKLALANTTDEYALKIIDPAIAPMLKSSPNRSLIVFISTIIGFIFSSLYVFIRYYLLN